LVQIGKELAEAENAARRAAGGLGSPSTPAVLVWPRQLKLSCVTSQDQIQQAIIGFGSAIIGAIVGGVFVFVAARGQWRADREEAAHQASREAARRIVATLVQLEGVFASLLDGLSVPTADAAATFNTFSAATTTELPFITDDQVCQRVLAHVELCWPMIRVASATPTPPQVWAAARRHADSVTEALEAHIRGAQLPSYKSLPKNPSGGIDVRALMSWPQG
jgi:hypothetical protein